MLSSETASLLQYFTLPVELIGFLLAFVEIRFPILARRLSKVIVVSDASTQPINSTVFRRKILNRRIPGRTSILTVLTFIGISIAIVIFNPPDWLIYGPGGVMFAFWAGHAFAARWVPGRAVGTVGLIMAGFGLAAELYQVLVQLYG